MRKSFKFTGSRHKMHVATAKVILDFFGNQNSKKKNEELLKLMTEVRRKFFVSIEEVEDFEDPERCVLGLCFVASSRPSAQKKLKSTLDYIDERSFARVTMSDGQVEAYELVDSLEEL